MDLYPALIGLFCSQASQKTAERCFALGWYLVLILLFALAVGLLVPVTMLFALSSYLFFLLSYLFIGLSLELYHNRPPLW